MATLEIEEVVVSPGGEFKLGPVSLRVERGEILCLVGPSGCGKTTLLRAVAGLLEPTEGRILLEGTLLNDPSIKVDPGKRKIGMVFQNLALWPHMKALDQVAFAVPGKGKERRVKARRLLEMVGLSEKAGSLPAELSGGEGQRVALARALAREPALLLMDEPLRSLDPHLRISLGKMIVEVVRREGVACLFVTHDREEALRLGDRTAVMNEGRILGMGRGEDLLRDPPHPFVEEFLGRGFVPPPPTEGPARPAGDGKEPPAAGIPSSLGKPAGGKGSGFLLRVSLLLGILGLVIGAVAAFSTKEPGKRRPPAFTSSAQCRPCHPEVYKEWEESWHAKAWTDPEVRKLSNDFRNQACLSCHVPRPVMETGLDQRVLPRTTRLKEGVGCLSCHMDGQGRVRGTRDVPQAPCSPVKSTDLGTNALCAPCHNQHFTHDQWKASPAAKEGKNCDSCHMPEALRRLPDGTTMKGWSHVFPGSHHPRFIHGAVSLEVKKEKGGLRLTVANVFAGHNFPTDSRHRASDLLVRFKKGDEWGPWKRVARFRQPYREEPGPNTQIPAGEKRSFRVEAPPGAVKAEVRLDYRATPFVPDDGAVRFDQVRYVDAEKAVVLYREEVDLP